MLLYKPAMHAHEVQTNSLHLPFDFALATAGAHYGRMPIDRVMGEPLIIRPNDSILATLNFKPYRSNVERRVIPFLPGPGESQTMEINTPWGMRLTARRGDFLVSELDAPMPCLCLV